MQRLEGYVETNTCELRSIHNYAVGHFLELVNLICADNFGDRVPPCLSPTEIAEKWRSEAYHQPHLSQNR
jgi:hypothetical protein